MAVEEGMTRPEYFQGNSFWPESSEYFGMTAAEEAESRGNISTTGVIAERRSYDKLRPVLENPITSCFRKPKHYFPRSSCTA